MVDVVPGLLMKQWNPEFNSTEHASFVSCASEFYPSVIEQSRLSTLKAMSHVAVKRGEIRHQSQHDTADTQLSIHTALSSMSSVSELQSHDASSEDYRW